MVTITKDMADLAKACHAGDKSAFLPFLDACREVMTEDVLAQFHYAEDCYLWPWKCSFVNLVCHKIENGIFEIEVE